MVFRSVLLSAVISLFSVSLFAQRAGDPGPSRIEFLPAEVIVEISRADLDEDSNASKELNLISRAQIISSRWEQVETSYYRPDSVLRRDWWPEEWANYESLSNERKARLFSDLAYYLPYEDALEMINRGFFRNRPWTWSEFDDELYRADRYWYYHLIARDEKTMIDLAKRLGFYDEKCTWTLVIFSDVILVKGKAQRQPEEDREFEVRLDFLNVDLLPGEKERFQVQWAGGGNQISVKPIISLNRYESVKRLPDEENIFQMVATRRNATANRLGVPNDLTATAYLELLNVGNQLILSFEDPYFDALNEATPGYEVILNYRLIEEGYWRNKEVLNTSVRISSADTEIDLSRYKKSKKSYHVVASVQRRKTHYFEARESAEYRTPTVRAR